MLRRSSPFLTLHPPHLLLSALFLFFVLLCFLCSVLQKSLFSPCFRTSLPPTVSVLRPSVLLQLLLITSQSFLSQHKPPRLSAKPAFSRIVTPNRRRSPVLTSFTGILGSSSALLMLLLSVIFVAHRPPTDETTS